MKTVSGKQFAKVLRNHGWTLERITKHHIYQSPDGTTVSVPVHNNQDLKMGILAALLKQTSLTEADL